MLDLAWEAGACDDEDAAQPDIVHCPYAGCEPCKSGCPSADKRKCVTGDEVRTVVQVWYRSLRNDQVWCESRSAQEVIDMSDPTDTFLRLEVYEVVGDWQPWNPNDTDR